MSSDDSLHNERRDPTLIHIPLHDVDPHTAQSSPPITGGGTFIPRLQSLVADHLPSLNGISRSGHTPSSRVRPSSSPKRRGFTRVETNDGDFIPLFPLDDADGNGIPLHTDAHHGQSHLGLNLPPTSQISISSTLHRILHSAQVTLQETLYPLLEDPSSSMEAFYVSVFVSAVIVAATIVATLETIPSLYSHEMNLWKVRHGLELFFIVTFSLEYTLRILARCNSFSDIWKYVCSPFGIIDLIAVLPYWLELISRGPEHPSSGDSVSDDISAHMSYVFRTTILKMFRLLGMFRVFRYSSLIQLSIDVLIIALKRSLDALSALVVLTVIILSVFSTLLYFAERGTYDPAVGSFVDDRGRPSTFDSIPRACWFVLSTLTTTGYGDMVPQTFAGKIITFPIMMCGVLLIALPSIVVGRNFAIVYEHLKTRQKAIQMQAITQGIHDETGGAVISQDASQSQSPLTSHVLQTETFPRPLTASNHASPTTITPVIAPQILPELAAIFDDPFSVRVSAATPGLTNLLPQDTHQLILYIAALSRSLATQQAHLHEAITTLRNNLELDHLAQSREQPLDTSPLHRD